MTQQIKQQDLQEFDYVKLFFHCIHYWYWFVLCIAVSICLVALYMQYTTNVYSVASTIMIRTDNNMSRSSLQADMMELMGYQSSKIIGDEVQIMTSHSIMEQAVRELGLQTEYRKKVGLRWVGQYPKADVLLTFQPGVLDTIRQLDVQIERTEKEYIIGLDYRKVKQEIHAQQINDPILTNAGLLTFNEIRA